MDQELPVWLNICKLNKRELGIKHHVAEPKKFLILADLDPQQWARRRERFRGW
jgi:hypothetical protein